PCTASVGVTGERKCFNLIRTCQDRDNFTAGTKTLRFCAPSESVDFTLDGAPVVVIPSIKSLSTTPGVIHPGVDIGQRESVRVTFQDHPHSDAGLDKYLADRDYDPFGRGTFWGKMRARVFSFEGYPIRILRGRYGQDLSEMTTYHYVVDSIAGQAESITLVAKDPLILSDKKKAQAPTISNGLLAADLSDSATSVGLSPSGIGALEYPASGKVAIGGKEICSFSRSGDTLTLTRAQSGTEAEDHDEGDRVQLVLEYSGDSPADIVSDLLTTYTPGVESSWIDLTEWQSEVDEYIGRLYSAEIAEPTPVSDLLNELIEQVGLVFWWDPVNQKIRLQSLRPVSDAAKLYDENLIVEGSLEAKEQPQSRISEVWTYYGLRNPLEPLDEANNYRAAIATVDAESSLDYVNPSIKKVHSRWITDVNRAAASRLNALLLSRYRTAPRKFSFELFNNCEPAPLAGGGFRLKSWALQDDTGAESQVAAQFVSVETRDDRYIVDAEESIFTPQEDLEDVKLIFIDSNAFNVNLRSLHDGIYSAAQSGDSVRCIIAAGATIGSSSSAASFQVGTWPTGVDIEIVINGAIRGRGGNGGDLTRATDGGTAFYTRYAVTVTNNGTIAGGGGGGDGYVQYVREYPGPIAIEGGGGGAGVNSGGGGIGAESGTATKGGKGFGIGRDGGDPGQDGGGALGGDAGNAVDGDSYVTFDTLGTVLGPRVN
ncbi:MAG: hypothetical protein AB7E55_31905, partial [Pigmentiphaga sp.]